MAQLTVYDSEGNEYGRQGPGGRPDERIREFFFAGVRVAVDLTRSPEVVGFFRARESDTGRSEQFYAVYRADSRSHLFSNFKSAVQDWADRNGLALETDMDDVEVFRKLTRSSGDPPGDDFDHQLFRTLLDRGERVRVGVGSYDDALALFRDYLQSSDVDRVAITDDSQGSALENYDLVIEQGRYRGVEPIGDTESAIERVRPEIEDQLVSETIDDVQDKLRDLRSRTTVDDAEIERQLRRRISFLSPPEPRGGGPGGTGGGKVSVGPLDLSRRQAGLALAAVGAVVVIVVALVVASQFGFVSLPFIGGGGDGGGSGSDGGAAGYADVPGTVFNNFRLDGESWPADGKVMTVTKDSISITGKYNASKVVVKRNGTVVETVASNDKKLATLDEEIKLPKSGTKYEITVIATFEGLDESKKKVATVRRKPRQPPTPSLSVDTPTNGTTVSGDTIAVNGTTNASKVRIELVANDTVEANETVDLSGSGTVTFNETLSTGNVTGNATLVVTALGDGKNATVRVNVTVNGTNVSALVAPSGSDTPAVADGAVVPGRLRSRAARAARPG